MFEHKWKRKKLYERPSEKLKYLRHVDQIVCWLYEKHDVIVTFDRKEDNEYCEDIKVVNINACSNYRCQLHSLLHEAGHVVLGKNKRKYKHRFPLANYSNRQTRHERVDILREEVFAWEEGLNIAKENHIRISKLWYYRHMRDSLYSYVEWACKKKTPVKKTRKKK